MQDKNEISREQYGQFTLAAEILESISDGFFALDRDWRFIYINQRAAVILESKREELIGQNLWKRFPGFVGTDHETCYRQAMQEGRPQECEIRGVTANQWYNIRVYPSHQGISVYWQDITERKKAEEDLTQAVQRLNAHMENSPLAVIEFDAQFRVIRWSKEAEHMFGWSAPEIMGRKISEMRWVYQEDIELVNHESANFVSGETPRHLNLNRNYRKDGSVIWCEWYNSSIYNSEGKLTSVLSQVLDITERKQMEEALKKYTQELEAANKELEAFSYSVSHDLRSPLRTLDGFSEAILQDYGDKLDETGQDYLNRIRKASQTMAQLIDDLLKLSRISRAEMVLERCNLSQMSYSILEELKYTQPYRKVEFKISPNIMVYVDKQLLNVALRNLLENAWKFTGRSPQAQIEVGTIQKNGERTYFIKDNGAGFDMRYQEKLFQPFQRLHSSKEYEGTGIGLAIVQRVVRRHGGKVWAESEPDKGATFYFTLG